jgi:hypothetical protein
MRTPSFHRLLPPSALAMALAALAALAPPAAADTLELADGRIVEGAVLEADGGFWVLSRFGPSFLEAKAVKARHVGKPVDEQVREQLQLLDPEDTRNRARIARWLKEIGRDEEACALAQQVIERDPEEAVAREVLGHLRHRGVWVTPDEAKRAEGYEKHGDRWYTPQEWKNLADAEKAAAEEAEKRAEAERVEREVNRFLRLLTSPDPAVRSRARSRLEALAREMPDGGKRLLEVVAALEDYTAQVDALREQAAAAESGVGGTVISEGGLVMGEIRATLSRLKRPIQVFETSLASGPVGANAPVRIQLPELEVIRVRTTGIVPAVVK